MKKRPIDKLEEILKDFFPYVYFKNIPETDFEEYQKRVSKTAIKIRTYMFPSKIKRYLLVLCLLFLCGCQYKITGYSEGTITKSGKRVAVGMCAVDPKVIPLGSKVWVQGLGIFVAEDTGGKVKGRHIDIYFKNERDAINWGVRHRRVIITRKGR